LSPSYLSSLGKARPTLTSGTTGGYVSPVTSDKLDENTAAAIAVVSQTSTGALSVRMHDKLAALIALGKHLGMFDQRTQKTAVVYAISDKPMSNEEWSKRHVTPH
jgi:hypothetical protein